MISFSFRSRDKRSKPAARKQQTTLEQQLFGAPAVAPPAEGIEPGSHDWFKSSSELRDGCEVQDIALDTLPDELTASFQR